MNSIHHSTNTYCFRYNEQHRHGTSCAHKLYQQQEDTQTDDRDGCRAGWLQTGLGPEEHKVEGLYPSS